MNKIGIKLLAALAVVLTAVVISCRPSESPTAVSQPAAVTTVQPLAPTNTVALAPSREIPPTMAVIQSTPETATSGAAATLPTAVSATKPASASSTPTPATVAATPEPTQPPLPTAAPTPAPSTAKVGTNVGDAAPDFAVQLTDSTEIASEQLLEPGRPVFMVYFATW